MMKIQSKKKKINTRPLTKKEKVLLCLLGLVILVWGSNRFIFQPQAEKTINFQAQKSDYEMQIIDINNTLKSEAEIKREWDTLQKERDQILSSYFPTLDQSQIIYLLNDLTKDESFNVKDLSFSRPTVERLGEVDVRNMEVSIPFSGNYDGIMDVVNSFNYSPKRILVDRLSMNTDNANDLSGDMSLKIYSLEGIAETDPNVIFVEPVDDSIAGIPFKAYDDFSGFSTGTDSVEEISNDDTYDENGEIVTSSDEKEGMRKELLHGFDYRNYTFIPSSPRVKGNVTPSSIAKSGKYSMRLEYNILAVEDENRAYVDITKSNIELKIPPASIGAWVYSFGYSPGSLGMRFTTQDGEVKEEILSDGITWLGWNYVETSLPPEFFNYPLSLDYIYFEIPENRDDFGVMLIDKMEAFYRIEGESTLENQESSIFYVVEEGDNVSEISRKIYGTTNYKNEIMKLNEINSGDVLHVGRVLVLKRH